MSDSMDKSAPPINMENDPPVAMMAPPVSTDTPGPNGGSAKPSWKHTPGHARKKPAPTSAEQDEEELQRSEDLRKLSAEMLDLQDILNKVIAGDTSLPVFADYITRKVASVTVLTQEMDGLGVKMDNEDMLQHILNAWDKIKAFSVISGPATPPDAQQQLHELTLVSSLIDTIVYQCGYMTIPTRLSRWLKETRPGYYIPFHEVFKDEVPNAEDRDRLLRFMAWSPAEFKDGYVDVDAGLVYKYSRNPIERVLSLVYMLLAFLITTGIVIWSCTANLPGWPLKPEHIGLLLPGWIFLLVGVVVHIGIGHIKDSRKQGLPALFAPGDIFFIINARLSQIVLKLFIALIGLFGLVMTNGISQFTLFSAFLVGYSLDSFVEMFGSSLSNQSASQLSNMQKQLGVAQE